MRNRCRRRLGSQFNENCFNPQCLCSDDINSIVITDEELETLRLRYIEKLDQDEASIKMGISQSQYQRDLSKALEKITKALINGYAINIKKIRS